MEMRAPRDGGAVLSVTGKGRKTRYVFLPDAMWQAVAALRNGAPDSAPVFASRELNAVTGMHNALSCNQMHRIAKQAAKRAGLPSTFSMHWCRHAHASHALDRGAPVHLVQQLSAMSRSPPPVATCTASRERPAHNSLRYRDRAVDAKHIHSVH